MFNLLAVIPARGGSKGIRRKNIRMLNGKPLVFYTINVANNCDFIGDVVVSTDDEEISSLSIDFGAQVPFIRPSSLATDETPSYDVVKHALLKMESQTNVLYDAVMMLQPTCPLRTVEDIDNSIRIFQSTGADSVVSVVELSDKHPFRMKRLIGDRLINYIDQGFEDMRPRQSLPKVYIRNGAIYVSTRRSFLSSESLVGEDCRAYLMPDSRSVNIDSEVDMLLAEKLLGSS